MGTARRRAAGDARRRDASFVHITPGRRRGLPRGPAGRAGGPDAGRDRHEDRPQRPHDCDGGRRDERHELAPARGRAGRRGEGGAKPFRRCDYVAWQLASLDGTPAFELFWTEARRDAAIDAPTAFLDRYGARFSAEALPGEPDFPHAKAPLKFPILDHPATTEDVCGAGAIFTLEGEGEARVVPLPKRLIRARWVTSKDFPYNQYDGQGHVRRAYEQDGWIWQAEEVRKADRWERFCGLVGRYVSHRPSPARVATSRVG
ncbi:MAG: hypothetical protein IRY99_27360 [Isosphaeraceae bacterium]|nr:hypothetical protein [Isosphaeraceae bacterium]